jgi:hypothetical protein
MLKRFIKNAALLIIICKGKLSYFDSQNERIIGGQRSMVSIE